MSVQAIEAVLHRADEDLAFRQLLERDPDAALHGYDIAYAERQALTAGDAMKLQELGVNPAVSELAAQYNWRGIEPREGV